MDELLDRQRALFRRWPTGVSVVVAANESRRSALTVSSLLSLSLDPPLVSISLSRSAVLYEVLDEAGRFGVSILAAGQEALAQHFARNVPPIALWDGIAVRDDEPLLLQGALGWVIARTLQRIETGDHALFIGAIESLEHGPGRGSLAYLEGRYTAL